MCSQRHSLLNRGFMLLEFLLYLSILSFIMFLSCHLITTMQLQFANASHRTNWLMSLYSAQEYLRRELEQAPSDRAAWQRCDDHELAFSRDGSYIRLGLSGDRLIRTKNSPAPESGSHHGSSTSTIAEHIKELHFSYDIHQSDVQGVQIELVGEYEQKPYTIKQYVHIPK